LSYYQLLRVVTNVLGIYASSNGILAASRSRDRVKRDKLAPEPSRRALAAACLPGPPRPGQDGRLSLLDDLHAVAILIMESEHRWPARPPRHGARVDAMLAQIGVIAASVCGSARASRSWPRVRRCST